MGRPDAPPAPPPYPLRVKAFEYACAMQADAEARAAMQAHAAGG